jgi:FkbM family methyltransferase
MGNSAERKPTAMTNDLIYDIGLFNGNDTAFYLACGYRVLAIEADPDLVTAAGKRFKAEIEAKRLTIINVAIAEKAGTAEFWINEKQPDLNSFDRQQTARHGDPYHSIKVQCGRLDDIVSEYGIPFYIKIDIEGHDIVCCNQLSPGNKPKYISVEMSRIELLLRLRDIGYDRFKLITQFDLQSVKMQDIELHVRVLRSFYRLANSRLDDRSLSMRLKRAGADSVLKLAHVLGLWEAAKPFKSRLLPEWNFGEGHGSTCSGTFGEDLPGEWLSWQEIAYLWHRDTREYQKMGRSFWCDLHATTTEKN